MSPTQLKILGIIVAAALLFGSGWAVNGWRLGAKQSAALKQLTEELTDRMQAQEREFQAAGDRLRLREAELNRRLDAERRAAELLREEIENAPVVTITERVEVPADCPPVRQCATVDSVRFRELYNRAALGALPDPGTGDQPVQ